MITLTTCFSKFRRTGTVAVLALSWLIPAGAVEIQWSPGDTFAYGATIAPGSALELCGAVDPRLPVEWRYQASGPLTFDIHRHSGSEVIYASRSYLTRQQNGRFSPTFQFDWCWTWANESAEPVSLRVDLKR
ncbi:MAG: hypothetical protein IT523_07435 [Burkholderiales bacterium]|nr:hypothetical protein [Pseudomonadota bacterium]MCC7068273.1 hypothetical protein [Burkholderiales bacterium]MCZ2135171.1 hypothetical protein [Burkholderiales bacterium]